MDQLLARIQPRPTGQQRLTQPRSTDTNSLLTLFLTPAFAQHALDTNLPLRFIQRFNQHRVVSKPLDAVVAVVDRLPAPVGPSTGVEGLAYAFVTSPYESLAISSQTPLQMSAQKPGSISFELPRPGRSSTTAHLPLAQTTFTNGLPSTLIHTHYDYDATTNSLHQSTSTRLESQKLPIPFRNNTAHVTYAMPFVPLTPVRKIMSSMGNIIRKLSPHSLTQEEHFKLDPGYVPEPSSFLAASQELETAVSDYFKLNGMAPGSVQVWALILPDRPKSVLAATSLPNALLNADRQLLETVWTDRDWEGLWTTKQFDMFAKGCRLARVLSGGGGWGKKAGLLSLDPDTGYSTRDLRGDQGWEFTFADEYTDETVADQQRQALGEIVKPGEHVMFFLAPKGAPSSSLLNDIRYTEESNGAMILGVIPSSIDEVSEGPVSGSTDNASLTEHHHRDMFGMLSEGGMAVTLVKKEDDPIQTKIDVPFGNLKIRASPVKEAGRNLGEYLVSLKADSGTDGNSRNVPSSREEHDGTSLKA